MEPIQFVLNEGETSQTIVDQIEQASTHALAMEFLDRNPGLSWLSAWSLGKKAYATMMADNANYADED